jgi:hypothetical protein
MKKLLPKSEYALDTMSEEAIIEKLHEFKSIGGVNIKLVFEQSWGDADLRWHYEVEETDEEYSRRLAWEEASTKKKQEAILKKREKDRALYEKLKQEFGE